MENGGSSDGDSDGDEFSDTFDHIGNVRKINIQGGRAEFPLSSKDLYCLTTFY